MISDGAFVVDKAGVEPKARKKKRLVLRSVRGRRAGQMYTGFHGNMGEPTVSLTKRNQRQGNWSNKAQVYQRCLTNGVSETMRHGRVSNTSEERS